LRRSLLSLDLKAAGWGRPPIVGWKEAAPVEIRHPYLVTLGLRPQKTKAQTATSKMNIEVGGANPLPERGSSAGEHDAYKRAL